jgi:tRNA A-37 threonylcarbamoyl transferase component Bud32
MNIQADKIIAVRTSKTVYRDGGRVIKLFGKDYDKSDVLNEALNQSRVEKTGLNVPKILEVNMFDGKWAVVWEYVSGKTLAELMREHPEKKDGYIELLVDVQIEVLSKSVPLLSNLTDKMQRKISQTAAYGFDATTRYDLHTRLDALPRHNKLCHGDFNPGNIIISNENLPYIIDWSHATNGNGAADAARTYLLFNLAGDFDGAEKYIELYCRKSDTAKQYVQKWFPVVAASQYTKGKEKEREFLRSWVNVVDYE